MAVLTSLSRILPVLLRKSRCGDGSSITQYLSLSSRVREMVLPGFLARPLICMFSTRTVPGGMERTAANGQSNGPHSHRGTSLTRDHLEFIVPWLFKLNRTNPSHSVITQSDYKRIEQWLSHLWLCAWRLEFFTNGSDWFINALEHDLEISDFIYLFFPLWSAAVGLISLNAERSFYWHAYQHLSHSKTHISHRSLIFSFTSCQQCEDDCF